MAKLIKEEVPFTQVANAVLNDKKISWKAKGLFAYIFSKPDNWSFALERIAADGPDGERLVRTGVQELEKAGYLERRKLATGRVDYLLKYSEKPSGGFGRVAKSQGGETAAISNKENVSNKDTKETSILAAPSAADSEKDINKRIAEIINAFKPVKPFIQKLYGQPPQRQAAKEMVDEFGFEKALKIAEYAVSVQGQPFAPVITTPYQLREKVGNLRIWAMGEKNKRQKLWSTL